MSNRSLCLLSIVVAAAFFLSTVLFAGSALRFWRLDFTAQDLYTLSDGTRSILSKIDEPVTVRLFYSKDVAAEIGLESYGRRVRELLEEFENAAQGKLVLQVIEPEQFSEEEELATSLGIRGQMVNASGDLLFFGIAATNSVDDLESIPRLDPSQEGFLEYELAKRVSKLAAPARAKVAVIGSLPLQGGAGANPFGPPEPGWRIVEVLRDIFEVEFLDPELTAPIDAETDVLLIVHPKDLSETTRFAIDQYALGGGKVCALVDAHCFFDQPPPGQQQGFVDATSRLDDLLGAWGVELVPSAVVGDLSMSQVIRTRQNSLIPFPLWMEVNALRGEEVFSADDVVTSAIQLVTLLTAGELRAAEEARTTFTPLIRTSPGGRSIDTQQLMFSQDILSLAPRILPDFQLHATGTIEFSGVPEDGASVTLGDGLRAPVTFEFSTDDEVAGDNVKVDVASATGPEAVVQALQLQVLLQSLSASDTSGLGIEATASGATLELRTQQPGPQGNLEIRRAGQLEAEVDGMRIRGVPKVLAARIQGPIESAFPGGAPEGWEGLDAPLTSSADFNAIVVADADFLHEQFWTTQVNQGGFLMQRSNDNPSVLVNALENLTGSNDLLSLRSRGIARRPFEKKEELERQARERYQAKNDELAKKQQRLEQEIRDLETGADEAGVIRISQQEFEELRDKQQALAETRKELGRVRGDLNRDIESLGKRIFYLNVGLAPLLVSLAGLLYGLRSLSRRQSK